MSATLNSAVDAFENASRPRGTWRGKQFDLVTLPPRQRVEACRARIGDLAALLHNAEAAMGVSLASEATVARIALAHPDTLWTFRRNDRVVGGFAFLMLNEAGLSALFADRLDFGNPPLEFLQPPGRRPAAIYVWAILGSAVGSEGIARVIVRMQQYPYERADLFALPATDDGLRFMCGLGFRPVPGHPRSLHRYVRLANRMKFNEENHECASA
jgi:hypothetical protein